MTRRQKFLVVWFLSVIGAGVSAYQASGVVAWGYCASFAVLGISVGVPLMRAFTEHSK